MLPIIKNSSANITKKSTTSRNGPLADCPRTARTIPHMSAAAAQTKSAKISTKNTICQVSKFLTSTRIWAIYIRKTSKRIR